ncbi:MAG: 2-oxoglutarate oxidoreductase [Mogibacterium sp.]|nr:2-oxoglutarate oxidoreductase [Mogibacterium sp.]
MKKVYKRTEGILPGKVSGFCPGCMHSTVHKIIGEAAEELGVIDKLVRVEGVGCCGLGQMYVSSDMILAAHGRAGAVATGVKRSTPDSLVYTYQGDGDLAAIGLGETISAANRGENFTVIFVNNGIYGMTGGQMAPTTLLGMKSTTTPKGRDAEEHGYPMHVCEVINQLTAPYYIHRVAVDTPQHVIEARKAIKKAFQYQMEGKGYSIVEIVTSCPTNWGLGTLESLEFLREKMFAEYPLGLVRDKGAEEK